MFGRDNGEDSRRCEGQSRINHKCGEKDKADYDVCDREREIVERVREWELERSCYLARERERDT